MKLSGALIRFFLAILRVLTVAAIVECFIAGWVVLTAFGSKYLLAGCMSIFSGAALMFGREFFRTKTRIDLILLFLYAFLVVGNLVTIFGYPFMNYEGELTDFLAIRTFVICVFLADKVRARPWAGWRASLKAIAKDIKAAINLKLLLRFTILVGIFTPMYALIVFDNFYALPLSEPSIKGVNYFPFYNFWWNATPLPDNEVEKDIELIKNLGANWVRLWAPYYNDTIEAGMHVAELFVKNGIKVAFNLMDPELYYQLYFNASAWMPIYKGSVIYAARLAKEHGVSALIVGNEMFGQVYWHFGGRVEDHRDKIYNFLIDLVNCARNEFDGYVSYALEYQPALETLDFSFLDFYTLNLYIPSYNITRCIFEGYLVFLFGAITKTYSAQSSGKMMWVTEYGAVTTVSAWKVGGEYMAVPLYPDDYDEDAQAEMIDLQLRALFAAKPHAIFVYSLGRNEGRKYYGIVKYPEGIPKKAYYVVQKWYKYGNRNEFAKMTLISLTIYLLYMVLGAIAQSIAALYKNVKRKS